MKSAMFLLGLFFFINVTGCSHRLQHPTKPRSEWSKDHAECEKESRGFIRESPDAYDFMDEHKMIERCMKEKGWHR